MGGWRLTIREASSVERLRFETLDEAAAELERRAGEIAGSTRLGEASFIRTFGPEERVAARLEISGPGWLRSADAGVDVKGDGTVVPYRNAVLKRALEPRRGESPYEAVREALGGRR